MSDLNERVARVKVLAKEYDAKVDDAFSKGKYTLGCIEAGGAFRAILKELEA